MTEGEFRIVDGVVIGMYKIENNILSKVNQCCKEVFFNLDVRFDIEDIVDMKLINSSYDILFVNIKEVIQNISVELKSMIDSTKTHIIALAEDIESLLYAL